MILIAVFCRMKEVHQKCAIIWKSHGVTLYVCVRRNQPRERWHPLFNHLLKRFSIDEHNFWFIVAESKAELSVMSTCLIDAMKAKVSDWNILFCQHEGTVEGMAWEKASFNSTINPLSWIAKVSFPFLLA